MGCTNNKNEQNGSQKGANIDTNSTKTMRNKLRKCGLGKGPPEGSPLHGGRKFPDVPQASGCIYTVDAYIYIYIYLFIYIYREREKERERDIHIDIYKKYLV